MEVGSEQRTPLSPHYAFVVQWATDTQIMDHNTTTGRDHHGYQL